jgi:septal ring factor EnvC (AmiA/AmiB activator)
MRNNILIILIIILIPFDFISQKKSEQLKRQERALIKKIENTKSLLNETKKNEALTISQLNIIRKQISYRDRLIRNYNAQIRKIDQNINDINRQINTLLNTNNVLIQEYKNMLVYAYKNRNPSYKFLYIISASTFSEAFHRMKYIQHYAEFRKKQVERIKQIKLLLIEKKKFLRVEISQKESVIKIKNSEKNNYLNDKDAQEKYLNDLKISESSLTQELKINNQKRKEIAKAVKKAIEEEIKAIEKKTKSKFNLTPEGLALSADFKKNKGKLAWPVARGEITSKYGKHQHDVVSTATVDNNGIDISTSKQALVRAVFDGKVTSVMVIPGAGKVVMISHGEYRSVYANLQEVFVQKGDQINTKENIGKLLPKSNGISEAHFEIWKISSEGMNTENPAFWLSR